jgi:hypothetical protein
MEKVWKKIGEKKGNSIRRLVELLWEEMGKEGDFKFSINSISTNEIKTRCTYCPFVELSNSEGLGKVGFAKFCMSDYGIVKGFNSEIGFTRTKTLMQGDDCYNHHYKMLTA